MARPKKIRNTDPTEVDIEKLDAELLLDAEKASAFHNNDDISVEETHDNDDIPEHIYPDPNKNDGDSVVNRQASDDHKYEMPPSQNPVHDDDNDDVPTFKDELPDVDFDPLEEQVKERDYTNVGKSNSNPNVQQFDPVIPEPVNVITPVDDNIVQELKKQKESEGLKSETTQPKKEVREPINPTLEDLSPAQKRKAAEQGADALLLAYGKFAPMPFKKISSFNLGKIDNMHIKGELDKNMSIAEDGTTVKNYCEQVNQQVDAIFEITPEMKDEIRPPLIEVLLENKLALTPTQRLIMAIGSQVVTMGITSIQLMRQNKAALNTFKSFHNENKIAASVVSRNTENIRHVEHRNPEPIQYKTEDIKAKQEAVYEHVEEAKQDDVPSYDNNSMKVEEYIDKSKDGGITVEETHDQD